MQRPTGARLAAVLGALLVLTATAATARAGEARKIVLAPGLDSRAAHDLVLAVDGLWHARQSGEGAVFYARGEELKALAAMGIETRMLFEDERDRARAAAERSGRPWPETTYAEMKSLLQNLATAHPAIARYHVLGTTVGGREIPALEITDQPDLDDPSEAEVRMQGNIHGDEYMSLELMCLLAQDLCQNYGVNPQVSALVDGREIWVIPSVNPDGHAAGTRANSRGVDLNRNHGYMWASGYGYGSGPFSEPELQVWYANATARNYSMSLSFHGEADYYNYPWNFTGRNAPDKSHFQALGNAYTDFQNDYTVVEGWDWYQTNGDTNDWSYGARGDFDVTIETYGYSSGEIATDWDINREAILYTIDQAQYGVAGVVTDATTGEPLPAVVFVVQKERWPSYTDPAAGDYHRPLTTGTYTLEVWANGREPATVSNVAVTTGATTVRNVALTRNYLAHAFQVAWNRIDSYYEGSSYSASWTWDGWAHYALGPADGLPASLGRSCELALDMGAGFEIEDGDGDDFTVTEADMGDGTESCRVYAASGPFGPWTLLGTATGTAAFDLAGSGLASARYLRFADDGDGSYGGDWPGYDLDAVTAEQGDPGCGLLDLAAGKVGCEGALAVTLADVDLDLDPGQPDSAVIHAATSSQPAGIDLTLTETGPASGAFAGTIEVSAGGGAGTLAVAHGDTLTAVYQDADCEGAPQTVSATAAVDCLPPALAGIEVVETTDSTALIAWTTDEPADSTVIYGIAGPQTTVHDENLTASHALLLTDLAECTGYVFVVASADEAGNETTENAGGAYFAFATRGVETLLAADMEANPGWSVTGDWGWGVPQGNAGDPSAGQTGTRVLGYNLNGAYANNLPQRALTAPAVDCSASEGVTLSFWRWLGVEENQYDEATLELSTNGGSNWQTLWSNPSDDLTDTEWTYCEFDLAAQADGRPDVRLRWVMGPTDGSVTYCGWNVDDVLLAGRLECPSPTPGPTLTPTPEATATPTATATPDVSPTPTPEPTAPPSELGVRLEMNATHFAAGQPFHLGISYWNRGPSARIRPLFVILDVSGAYWFWPGWTPALDWRSQVLPAGSEVTDEALLDFTWPSGAGAFQGVRFWAAFTDEAMSAIEGDYDMATWGFR